MECCGVLWRVAVCYWMFLSVSYLVLWSVAEWLRGVS